LDMLVPSVCLIIPPPNPLSVSLANKNEQYYESILSIWSQLYINVKSLIAWQYCLLDISHINSLTISMLSKMRPEEYRQLIKNLETHYEEFKLVCQNSQMFADDDKRSIENQYNGAQTHYDQLVVQLPAYSEEEGMTSRSLSELYALRLRLESAESLLSQHVCLICLGEDEVHNCGLRITELQTVQRDVELMRKDYLSLKESILKELEGMNDADKANFLRNEIEVIDQRLSSLDSSSSSSLQRLQALRDMLESVAQAEDIVKVHEARLTEKETTSLSPSEVEDYILTLESVKAELEQKKDALASMEAEFAKVSHCSSHVGGAFHRCPIMLSKHTEQVGLLSDRWRRILGQIDVRLQDLQLYLPQLQHYKQTSSSLSEWIDATRKRQDVLQATKIESVQALRDHINTQKELNAEIKAKRETVESVLKDNVACVNSIKDYETDLASYTSGLETLFNIPVKRTMLNSPSVDLHQEVALQTRYMELLTLSGDYYKFLGELLIKMEELKICNTRNEVLEEELRQLREKIQDRDAKNRSLEDELASYQLQVTTCQEKMLSIEEVERTTAMQCNATKESLDTTQSQLTDLNDQVTRLTYLLEEEKRKKRLAEERYTQQQEEYESVLRKRQKELETVSWSKVEYEKSVATKDHELELLRRQLDDATARVKELQKEISKVRSQCSEEISNLKLSYESQIHISRTDVQRLAAQREEDTTELQLQYDRMEAERRNLEEELRRLRVSISQTEEQKKRTEEEAHSQRAVITEEGRRRRELESQVEVLMRQRDQESSKYREELAEAMNELQEKSEQLAYVTHSLEEETRRRKTTEEGQGVLEQTVAQLQVKLTNSSMAATQLRQCEEELQKIRVELERESRERSRVEQNLSRLQVRIKDVQTVRDGLESQVENLRKASQEEVARRRQLETELEKSTKTMTEYTSTIASLRQSLEQTNTSGKRGEEERLRLQEELERSLRQNKTSSENTTQLSTELKALQKQLLQEQARVKEANFRNESLYITIEEKSKALNENSTELQRLKEMIETQTKERLRLEEELRTARHDKEELLRSKQGSDDELSSQITALQLQLQATERSNVEYRNLVSELSSEREKLKLETERIQKQVTEVHGSLITATMKSTQSQYSEIVEDRDALLLKLQLSGKDKNRLQTVEEELSRIKLSLDSELRNKQRLQEEIERLKRDVSYWKDQHESQQSLIRQYDTDKESLEREKNNLKSEIDRLMRELRELEEMYKGRLSAIQKELREMTSVRQTMETELKKLREPPPLDASSVIFEGVRKPVTADQLLDCGVLDKPTFSQLAKGHKTVPEVSADKKVSLKGTGPIAGVVIEGPKGPGSMTGLLLKQSFTEAKKENLLPTDSIDLLLDAQAATGHIIDPKTNQKLTVDEAYQQGVIDAQDRERLLAAEAAAVGYNSPRTNKPLSAFQAMKKGLIDKNTTLRLLQAQESVGGILDPALSVFLPKDTAIERDLIDDDIYRALNKKPELYMDPESEEGATYMSLKRRCKVELHTGLLLLPVSEKTDASKLVFDGVRKPVTAQQLLDVGVLDKATFKQLMKGEKTVADVSVDKKVFLKGTGSIAGVAAGPSKKMSFTEAKKQKIMPSNCADMLLDAQAATGHIIDPRTNQKLTVQEACARGVVDKEDESKLFAAEAAAVGYRDPSSAKLLSAGQAMKRGLIDRDTTLRILQAQESVGGILDPVLSVFLPRDIAMNRGYFDEKMNRILTSQGVETKGFFDPNTEENLTYQELKKRCTTDKKTGLILLPIIDKSKSESTLRKRRVLIVVPEINKEMTVREAYDKGYIDHETYLELSQQECEWEEITITAPDGSTQFLINDKMTGRQYDITELLEKRLIDQSDLDRYRSQAISLNEFADIITKKTRHHGSLSVSSSSSSSSSRPSAASMTTRRTTTVTKQAGTFSSGSQDSPDSYQHLSSMSVTMASPVDTVVEQEPVGAIFDTETLEKISITEALNRGLVDSITAQRLLEAQACTGGIVNPTNGRRLGIQEASRLGIINDDMASKLKPAQKAYVGFEDVKTRKKMSVAEAMKEMWLPYEAGQRFMEFQYVTGGLHDPELGCRRSIEDALNLGWLDGRSPQDIKHHTKNLTCPKSKLKISYKHALDNCLVEESTGVKMLQASSMSSRGISSPYNVSSTPGSTTGSRSGSRRSSRRSSVDLGSPGILSTRYSHTSFN
uniref:Desmoplakin n=1 Tax=Seriola lalandi dorsalis TaxID=1841481 RepID=A0A3B4XVV0_SERLL